MAHLSDSIDHPASPGNTPFNFVTFGLASMMAKFKVKRPAKTDIEFLLEYSDAELADIGLLRSELSEALFENAADTQAEAMLRIYQ